MKINIDRNKVERYIYICGGVILFVGFFLLLILYLLDSLFKEIFAFWGSL